MPDPQCGDGLTFLVVDDQEEILELVRFIVQSAGHECLVASSAREARDVLEHRAPDLVLLDVTMPEVDGPTFLRQLQNEGRELPPVVFLSALPSQELRRISADLGVPAIQKPFTRAVLRESIERFFGLRV